MRKPVALAASPLASLPMSSTLLLEEPLLRVCTLFHVSMVAAGRSRVDTMIRWK